MTISSEIRKEGPYDGDGVVTSFPFYFKIFKAEDVLVVRADSAGAETTLVLNSDYTVTLAPDQNTSPGGTVVLAGALMISTTLTIASRLLNLQPVDLTNQGGFYPRVINDALDRLTILVQQLAERVSRSLKMAISTPPGVEPQLPAPTPETLIGWNSSGDGFVNVNRSDAALYEFSQAGIGAVRRSVESRLREIVSIEDYGGVGDGVTDATTAIQHMEMAYSGTRVDLNGKAFRVSEYPIGNSYENGEFVISKTISTGGTPYPYLWSAKAAEYTSAGSGINILRDCHPGSANRPYALIQSLAIQSFAFDEQNKYIYTLHVSPAPEVSYISQYSMVGGVSARTASWVSAPSALIGHQGLALEYIGDGFVKLWSGVRYDSIGAPIGGRQVIRFDVDEHTGVISNIETYTLFGPEFSYLTHTAMPSVSNCGRFLVATGRKTSRDFWVRVFEMSRLISGGGGDYSDKWIYQFNVDQDILRDDALGNLRPVQGIACDGESIYILSGNARLTYKHIARYTLKGRFEQSNPFISVGMAEAQAQGTFYEPEGLAFYRPSASDPAALVMNVVSGPGGNFTNRLWVMGNRSSINQERGNLAQGTYTPTITYVTNCNTNFLFECYWTRVGDVVTVSGRISVSAISGSSNTEFSIDLPITSAFPSIVNVAGTFASQLAGFPASGAVLGDTTNKRALFRVVPNTTNTIPYSFTFSYRVL